MVCATISLYAQTTSEIKPLNIGDTVPDVFLHNIINYKTASSRLSDFRGKLMILDFWATWCSSCIEGFPKLAALQEKFRNRLQVFLVNSKSTRDSKKKIVAFFHQRKLPDGESYQLPVIIKDTVLYKLFPHQLIPHYVWISPRGIVIATTGSGQVNATNINGLLEGKNIHLRMKIDVMNFNRNQPLFIEDEAKSEKHIKYYSVISAHITGIPTGAFGNEDKKGLMTRLCYTNWSIGQLYRMAYQITWPDNRTILEVRDPSKIECKGDSCDSWYPENAYCYELVLPPTAKQATYEKMQSDLTSFFGYDARIEERTISCLVLKNNPLIKKPVSKGGTPADNLGNEGESKYIHHEPVTVLVNYLDRILPWSVMNETNFTKPVNIDLPVNLSDTSLLRKALYKAGFSLVNSKRAMKVFVIEDKHMGSDKDKASGNP